MSIPVATPCQLPISGHHRFASEAISEALGVGETQAIALIKFGAAYLNRSRLTEDVATQEGDWLRFHPSPRRFPADGIAWREKIVSETPDYLIVNKPAGVPVHATCDNAVENVQTQLSLETGHPLKIVHRLDIATQGLMVFAKTAVFQTHFNQLLLTREIKKYYRALIPTALPLGKVLHYMLPAKRAPRTVTTDGDSGGKLCSLEIQSCRSVDKFFEVALELHTGRNHQIRCQLASLGTPIVGDDLYGSPLVAPEALVNGETIALQAYALSFDGKTFCLPAPW